MEPVAAINGVHRHSARFRRGHTPDHLDGADFFAAWPLEKRATEAIAAVLNGPVAAAYLDALDASQVDPLTVLEAMPIPRFADGAFSQLTDLVSSYRVERTWRERNPAFRTAQLVSEHAGLRVDLDNHLTLLVVRAYDLPSHLERQMLDARNISPDLAVLPLRNLQSNSETDMIDDRQSDADAPSAESIAEADTMLEADLKRLEDRLRVTRPDLFDETGAFREDEAQRLLEQRGREKREAAREAIAALMRGTDT